MDHGLRLLLIVIIPLNLFPHVILHKVADGFALFNLVTDLRCRNSEQRGIKNSNLCAPGINDIEAGTFVNDKRIVLCQQFKIFPLRKVLKTITADDDGKPCWGYFSWR
jgi:hypothetical protein